MDGWGYADCVWVTVCVRRVKFFSLGEKRERERDGIPKVSHPRKIKLAQETHEVRKEREEGKTFILFHGAFLFLFLSFSLIKKLGSAARPSACVQVWVSETSAILNQPADFSHGTSRHLNTHTEIGRESSRHSSSYEPQKTSEGDEDDIIMIHKTLSLSLSLTVFLMSRFISSCPGKERKAEPRSSSILLTHSHTQNSHKNGIPLWKGALKEISFLSLSRQDTQASFERKETLIHAFQVLTHTERERERICHILCVWLSF